MHTLRGLKVALAMPSCRPESSTNARFFEDSDGTQDNTCSTKGLLLNVLGDRVAFPVRATGPKLQNNLNRSRIGFQAIRRNWGKVGQECRISCIFDLLYPQFFWTAWNPILDLF